MAGWAGMTLERPSVTPVPGTLGLRVAYSDAWHEVKPCVVISGPNLHLMAVIGAFLIVMLEKPMLQGSTRNVGHWLREE